MNLKAKRLKNIQIFFELKQENKQTSLKISVSWPA